MGGRAVIILIYWFIDVMIAWGGGFKMTEQEKRQRRCCFTGHRPQKLHRAEIDIKKDLEEAIKKAISGGYSTFITGMAYGVDIWAGEIVVRLRESNPELHLIAAIPYPDFCARWSSDWKRRSDALLEKADLIKYICPSYNAGAYQRRNEWMVDHSAHVIAVFNGEKSGTKNTIDYARKCEVEIEIIQA